MSGRLVLVRHGQSYGNLARRLDTRPPGTGLTPLGREQAREFVRTLPLQPGLLVHSVATRAAQTAAEIAAALALSPRPLAGIHEVQAGALEDRDDDAALAEFNAVYERWHRGERDVSLPGGETAGAVLDRYLPVVTELRARYLDDRAGSAGSGDVIVVSHGAAIRLVAAVLAGVDADFAVQHHLGNAEPVVLVPGAAGHWTCLRWGARTPPFEPESPAGADGSGSSAAAEPMG